MNNSDGDELKNFKLNYYCNTITPRDILLLRLENDYFRNMMFEIDKKEQSEGYKTFTLNVKEDCIEEFEKLLEENQHLFTE